MSNFNDLVGNFNQGNILLVGDIMLDEYVRGDVSRISPEGPIPVLKVLNQDNVLGGAGNVLANLKAIGANATFIGVIGDDSAGQTISEKIRDCGSDTNALIIDKARPTTVKTRFMAQNQQLLRVDNEDGSTISAQIESQILKSAQSHISNANIMVLSDYGKGVLTPSLIRALIKMAQDKNIPVMVDPKGTDYSVYSGATLLTPNKKELSEATNHMPVKTNADVVTAARYLIKEFDIKNVMATRSDDGISVIPHQGDASHYRTKSIAVYDVSGAGDTVVAVTAACLAAGGSFDDAAQISNAAGAIVVAKVGTATLTQKEILNYLGDTDSVQNLGVTDLDRAKDQIRKWQAQGLKVGFTNGCFDILHYGHVNYLAQAKQKCDRLVLGLNHDKSVKILKGDTRPINDEGARASVMAALSSIDMVVYFGAQNPDDDNTPCEIVGFLKPDILMKGGDYTIDQLPEGQVALSYGGQVEIMPLYDGYSTTNIIEKSKQN